MQCVSMTHVSCLGCLGCPVALTLDQCLASDSWDVSDNQSTTPITPRRHGVARLRLKNVAPPTVLAVNCFQHPQPSEKYKSKTVRPNPFPRPSVKRTDTDAEV